MNEQLTANGLNSIENALILYPTIYLSISYFTVYCQYRRFLIY